jgi:hypothetical protein
MEMTYSVLRTVKIQMTRISRNVDGSANSGVRDSKSNRNPAPLD